MRSAPGVLFLLLGCGPLFGACEWQANPELTLRVGTTYAFDFPNTGSLGGASVMARVPAACGTLKATVKSGTLPGGVVLRQTADADASYLYLEGMTDQESDSSLTIQMKVGESAAWPLGMVGVPFPEGCTAQFSAAASTGVQLYPPNPTIPGVTLANSGTRVMMSGTPTETGQWVIRAQYLFPGGYMAAWGVPFKILPRPTLAPSYGASVYNAYRLTDARRLYHGYFTPWATSTYGPMLNAAVCPTTMRESVHVTVLGEAAGWVSFDQADAATNTPMAFTVNPQGKTEGTYPVGVEVSGAGVGTATFHLSFYVPDGGPYTLNVGPTPLVITGRAGETLTGRLTATASDAGERGGAGRVAERDGAGGGDAGRAGGGPGGDAHGAELQYGGGRDGGGPAAEGRRQG
jgi:hypothetical protein